MWNAPVGHNGKSRSTRSESAPAGAQITTARVARPAALVTFFLTLIRRLQRLGTVPAIDCPVYKQTFRD